MAEIEKVYCPCCKSDFTGKIEERNDNGVIGPGFRSWIVKGYNICLECGVYFKSGDQLKALRKAAIENSKKH